MTRHHLFLLCFISVLSAPSSYAQEIEPIDASLDSLLQIPISTASKYWQTVEEAPASVTIITSSQIERFGYRTIDQVIMSVRGFYVTNDLNYGYVGVRGFGRPSDYNNRVLLLINGHTLNENIYGLSAFGTDLGLSMDAIDRIEIVRGPGSALYGTNAMFAVVNLVTKKGITLDGLHASATAGSQDLYEGSLFWGKEYDNGLDVFFSSHISDKKGGDLYFSEFDDPSTNNGVAQHLDWDKYWSFLTTMAYGDLKLQAFSATREKAVPTAAFETVFNDPSFTTLDSRQFLELQWNPSLGAGKELLLRGYYDRYFYEASYPYDDGPWDETNLGNWVGVEFQFNWETAPNNKTIFGIEYQHHPRADYVAEYVGSDPYNRNFPYSIKSLYMQNEYQPAENLSLTVGLRYDYYSTFGSTVNPRGAIVYNPWKGSTLKLLYGTAFRAPSVYEVYFGNSELDVAANLNPETIRTTELVWEQRITEDLFGIVSLYDYRMKNLIDNILNPTTLLGEFQNVSTVRAQGVEFELNFRLQNNLRGYVSYAYQQAEAGSEGVTLTNSPEHLAKGGASYTLFKHLDASVELLYESGRKTIYDTRTDDYVLTNLTLLSPLVLEKFKFSFAIKNVFDVQYKFPGGVEHIQNAIIQPGRSFIVKAEIKL